LAKNVVDQVKGMPGVQLTDPCPLGSHRRNPEAKKGAICAKRGGEFEPKCPPTPKGVTSNRNLLEKKKTS